MSCSRGRGSANCCVNTVGLVVVTVPLCMVLGVGAAWLVERTDVPGRAVWRPLFVAPLAVPAFVNSYAWVSVVPSLHGFGGGVLISTLSYFPFVYLPAAATLRRLDPAVEESARALGSGSAGVFFRVVLPQLRLAILGGGLLIGVHLLAEYGAFAMLRFDTFTTAIFEQFQATFDGAAGSMLAGVLVLCAWCCWSPRRGARQRPISPASAPARRARRHRFAWAATHYRHSGARRACRCWPSGCRCGRSCAGCGSAEPRSGCSTISAPHWARPSDWPPRRRC